MTQLDVYSAPEQARSNLFGFTQKGMIAVVFATFFATVVGLSPAPALASGALPAEQEMAIGDPNAPVTVIEYASMTCPHCAKFHTDYLPAIKKKYIDTGKVRLVFREFPLDRAAFQASILARCSGADRFFPYISILFDQQPKWSRAKNQAAELAKLGQMGGLSAEDFNACLADKKLGDGILKTRKDGSEDHDINSTPSFVIDGKTYGGALDLKSFSEAVDPLLD